MSYLILHTQQPHSQYSKTVELDSLMQLPMHLKKHSFYLSYLHPCLLFLTSWVRKTIGKIMSVLPQPAHLPKTPLIGVMWDWEPPEPGPSTTSTASFPRQLPFLAQSRILCFHLGKFRQKHQLLSLLQLYGMWKLEKKTKKNSTFTNHTAGKISSFRYCLSCTSIGVIYLVSCGHQYIEKTSRPVDAKCILEHSCAKQQTAKPRSRGDTNQKINHIHFLHIE